MVLLTVLGDMHRVSEQEKIGMYNNVSENGIFGLWNGSFAPVSDVST
jgi:hypothetical protein